MKAGSEKKADRGAVALKFRRKTPMLCRWLGLGTQPNSRCSATMRARSWQFALVFFRLETGPLHGAHTDLDFIPDSARLALPRPPESGIEVSTEQNFLSREKR